MSEEPNQRQDAESKAAQQRAVSRGVSRGVKVIGGLNALLVLLLVAAIAAMANYLAFRHYKAFDWTSAKYYKLSSQTQNILRNLPGAVEVFVVMSIDDPVYDYVKPLLEEYGAAAQQNLRVQYFDPAIKNVTLEQLIKQFDIAEEESVVVFRYGDRSKVLKHGRWTSDLVDMDMSGMMMGRGPRISNYKAEEAFTSAIVNVIEQKQPKLYFLESHGERELDDSRSGGGLSQLKIALTRQNIVAEPLLLLQTGKVPEDCDVLVVPGPQVALAPPEVALIASYLDNKGRALFLLDPDARNVSNTFGLGELLAKWNVQLGHNFIINPPMALAVSAQSLLVIEMGEVYCSDYGAHPITDPLRKFTTIFRGARTVGEKERSTTADRPRVTELVRSSANYWAETSVADLSSPRPKFDEGMDVKGPVPLAVAVESAAPDGVALGGTRLVVVGNSRFVADGEKVEANTAFFLNSINWLLERKTMLGIPPKASQNYKVEMTPKQFRTVALGASLGLPLLAALCGLGVWWRRRR